MVCSARKVGASLAREKPSRWASTIKPIVNADEFGGPLFRPAEPENRSAEGGISFRPEDVHRQPRPIPRRHVARAADPAVVDGLGVARVLAEGGDFRGLGLRDGGGDPQRHEDQERGEQERTGERIAGHDNLLRDVYEPGDGQGFSARAAPFLRSMSLNFQKCPRTIRNGPSFWA